MNPSTKIKNRWFNQREMGRALSPLKDATPREVTALLQEHGLLGLDRKPTPMAQQKGMVREVDTSPAWLAPDDPRREARAKRIQWHREKTLSYLAEKGVVLATPVQQWAHVLADQLGANDGNQFCDLEAANFKWHYDRFKAHLDEVPNLGGEPGSFMTLVAQLLEQKIGKPKTVRALKKLGWEEALRANHLEKALPPAPEPASRRLRF